jgi:cytidine deaminase
MLEAAISEKLRRSAEEGRRRAYAPYSKFAVGAAVLSHSGELFAACNVENASYGLTICAERAAVCAAVAAGVQTIQAVAIVSPGGHAPCGACRQVLAEFGPTMEVMLIDADDPSSVRLTTLDRLLPEPFGGAALSR